MRKALCALSLILAMGGAMVVVDAAPKTQPKAGAAAEKPETKKEEQQQRGILDTSYQETQALSLLKNVDTWVGQKVSFEGTFITFSPYALDYKGAMRESKDFVAFLIERPDVKQHTIPLSELKLIFPRKKADSVMDLEGGDKIMIKGQVFSAALGDPWVDVDEVIILQKTPDSKLKGNKKKKNAELE